MAREVSVGFGDSIHVQIERAAVVVEQLEALLQDVAVLEEKIDDQAR